MPSGKQLGIGLGIKAGVDGFLNSFYQAKQYEMQEKQQQNSVILNAVMGQLQDETIPLFERAKILDSIPNLVGAKLKVPLSQMLHLDEYNKHLEEDPNQPAIAGTQGQGGGSLNSDDTNSPNAGQTLQLKGTQSAPAVPQGMTERGNLSIAQIKSKLIKKQRDAEDEKDVEKAEKIAQFSFDLQEKSYKANGYKITSEGTDKDGEYVQVLTNNAGDIKVNRMPKGYKPLKLQIAETSVNKPSTFVREREDYWESQGLSPEEASKKALADTNDKYNLKQETGKAYVKSIEQGNAGTKPLSPAQVADDERANKQIRLGLQTSLDNARSVAIQSSEHASSQAAISQQFFDNNVAPLKAQMEAALKEADGDITDTDYLKAQKQYNAANSNWLNGTKKLSDLAGAADKQHKAQLSAAEERFNQFNTNGQVTSQENIGKVAKAYIDKYFAGDIEKAKAAYKQKFGRELDTTK